jgi:putative endonuclease
MAKHYELGKAGEQLAKAHLISKDYTILETNFRIGKLELDIIAEKEGILIIIEVRTRTTNWYLEPEATIGYHKIKHLVQATQGYIKMMHWSGETRFDIIAITGSPDGNYQLDHFEDAFQPLP